MSILVGIAAGGIIELTNVYTPGSLEDKIDVISFDPIIFLVLQLPPIIFNSGYHINRSLFLVNFTPIFLFAVLGTILSLVIITGILYWAKNSHFLAVGFDISLAELAAFGALISATDPVSTLAIFQQKRVDLQLFYLVFGESVVNDAVGLVLFDTCARVANEGNEFQFGYQLANILFIFVCSLILGILFAVGFALLFRHVDFEHNQLVELSLFILIIYFPFVMAEFWEFQVL